MPKAVKRRYASARRDEQAHETRLRIIGAARELFVTKGYGRTTLVAIAQEAGVAVETVYAAFGNKATLLHQTWYMDFRGDEEDVPLFERDEMQGILNEPDLAKRVRRHAVFVAATNRRTGPLTAALEGAAASEPAAAEMLAEFSARRLDVTTKYAKAAAATGRLAVSQAECRDVLFATMDGTLWRRLVVERGWSDERYADWLGSLWIAQLVSSAAGAQGPD
jgi:TetR/AcrR family transcriptional regulator, regulator of autoinduction and epiphytic fitness